MVEGHVRLDREGVDEDLVEGWVACSGLVDADSPWVTVMAVSARAVPRVWSSSPFSPRSRSAGRASMVTARSASSPCCTVRSSSADSIRLVRWSTGHRGAASIASNEPSPANRSSAWPRPAAIRPAAGSAHHRYRSHSRWSCPMIVVVLHYLLVAHETPRTKE